MDAHKCAFSCGSILSFPSPRNDGADKAAGSQPRWTFVYLAHPRSVTGFQWREQSAMSAKRYVLSMLRLNIGFFTRKCLS